MAASYGTKEYYEERVKSANVRLDMFKTALKHKLAEDWLRDDEIYYMCDAYKDAYDEAENAKERYNVYCANASSVTESPEV